MKLCVQDLIDYGVDGSKRTEFEDSLRKQVTEIKKSIISRMVLKINMRRK